MRELEPGDRSFVLPVTPVDLIRSVSIFVLKVVSSEKLA